MNPASDDLNLDDWRRIEYIVQKFYNDTRARRGEPPNSRLFKDEERRISLFLLRKAYPPLTKRDGDESH